jgi:hypothetical protein
VEADEAVLFKRIDKEGCLPTTAVPSPGKFVAAYEKAFADSRWQARDARAGTHQEKVALWELAG